MDYKAAHKFSTYNRASIEKRALCGCFNCQTIFHSLGTRERKDWPIQEWTDRGHTAKCPLCGVDAVLSSADVPDVSDPNFMRGMHDYWFSDTG